VETLIAAMLEDADVRLPGERRRRNAERARREGVDVPVELLTRIRALAVG
jgi:(2R)-3-sulfolactate dehydrogenase (NADP+)